ncbi:unnamed protein product, partial [Schistosoma curassoni]|uniref:Peptidase S1 domain-containing protein n=1 Tax=Schistosoma curassoni TaxID=6186 RepID=A0A183JE23_9TREM
ASSYSIRHCVVERNQIVVATARCAASTSNNRTSNHESKTIRYISN